MFSLFKKKEQKILSLPKIGDELYIPPERYIDFNPAEREGGLAKVIEVDAEQDRIVFAEFGEFSLRKFQEQQEKLEKRFSKQRARFLRQ